MSIQNIQCWYGTTNQCLNLSEQIAGALNVETKLALDTDIYGGSNVPANIVVGTSFMVSCQGAFYAATLDVIDPDDENGYIAVADTQAGVALVSPATLINKPVDAGTFDPARVIRATLMFEPPESAITAYHVAPGLTGADRRFVFTAGSRVVRQSVAATTSAVAGDGTSLTVTGKAGA